MSSRPRRQRGRRKPTASQARTKPSRRAGREAAFRLKDRREQPRENQRRSLSGRRFWLFRLLAVVAGPIVALGLCEAVLRISGYGYRPHLTVACEVNGVAHRGDNVKFSWRFFRPYWPESSSRLFFLPRSLPRRIVFSCWELPPPRACRTTPFASAGFSR